MHILCLHCQNPIEVDKVDAEEILCSSCGSSFRLESGSTTGWKNGGERKVGKFELLEMVGVETFGSVFKARHTELDRVVAIKVPRAGKLGSTSGDADRFLREARNVAQLRHPVGGAGRGVVLRARAPASSSFRPEVAPDAPVALPECQLGWT